MSRLWEKGLPLDERVLRYTAGEDHLLDARLVPYDVRGSIAHAEMLAARDLISHDDCHAICDGLRELEASFDRGEWKITLDVFRDLGLAFGAAQLGIFVILMFQTQSRVLPLVIMLAIPFGVVGAVLLGGAAVAYLFLRSPDSGAGAAATASASATAMSSSVRVTGTTPA